MRHDPQLISAIQGATSRSTKDLLEAHGPAFYVIATVMGGAEGNRPGLLVKSLSGWIGWLPTNEVSLSPLET